VGPGLPVRIKVEEHRLQRLDRKQALEDDIYGTKEYVPGPTGEVRPVRPGAKRDCGWGFKPAAGGGNQAGMPRPFVESSAIPTGGRFVFGG
jgi:hypothetical protein